MERRDRAAVMTGAAGAVGAAAARRFADEGARLRLADETPLGRFARAEEIASIAVFPGFRGRERHRRGDHRRHRRLVRGVTEALGFSPGAGGGPAPRASRRRWAA
jgi:NAD(P)-dependent dehydrogenase (short-subunit alcohol dehydrogenase family)